jgi:energy-coupling factor transporter ATP-binding protein EcfA2
MTFDIRPAKPEHQPIILGITGPSGSGKTMSALELAHGIQEVVGGEIGVIDTEGRRALRYSDKARYPHYAFKHLEFTPPFSSDRYAEALAEMHREGAKTIIVDSMSHEHEGQGGYLEFHEAELDRMAGNDYKKRERMTFTAWIKPAAARRRLINSFLQLPANFIFCFRAKEKLKIVTGSNPIPLGWQAIAGDEFVYEMIVRCLLPPGAKGVPDWSPEAFAHGAAKRDDQDRHLFPDGKPLSREIGRNLAREYSAGKTAVRPRLDPTPTPKQEATPPSSTGDAPVKSDSKIEDARRELDLAAKEGTAKLAEVWEKVGKWGPEVHKALEGHKNLLKPRAAAVDSQRP